MRPVVSPGAQTADSPRVGAWRAIWLWALALALVGGTVLRLGAFSHKPWWGDELATLVVLAGCTNADLERFHDGRPHTADELLVCHRVTPERGYADLLRALFDEGPQNFPLYFMLSRALTRTLDSEWGPRLVSVIASVLALGAGALLGHALFDSWLAGIVVAALAAVSPLHVRFGLDARDYSLWSLGTAVSSWLLVRAHRNNRRSDWVRFAIAQVVCLNANLLALPTSLALLGWGWVTTSPPRWSGGARFRRHVLSLTAAGLSVLPWAAVVLLHQGTVERTLNWTARDMPLAELARRWFGIATTIFLRTGADGGLIGAGEDLETAAFRLAIGGAIALLLVASVRTVVRTRSFAVWTFPLFLGLPLFLALALPDLVLGGRRSMMARYLLPTWWAAELVVAGALTTWLDDTRSRTRTWISSLLLLTLLGLGFWSSLRATALEVWWDVDPPTLRAQVAEADHARVASSLHDRRRGELSYLLWNAPHYQLLGFARLLPSATTIVLEPRDPATARTGCSALELFSLEFGKPEPRVLRCDGPGT